MQHKKKTGDENLRARGELQAILTSYSSQNAGEHTMIPPAPLQGLILLIKTCKN